MSTVLERATEVIESRIRPMIQGDGGDIEIVELTPEGVLRVRLQGACVNCSGSAMTVSFGIEAHIKDLIPEIKSVELVA